MLLVANWKAYVENTTKAKALMAAGKRVASKEVQVVLAPPAPLLGLFTDLKSKYLSLGAQDLSDSTGGAATGETTASLLSGMKVKYVILGHSERRAMGESDSLVLSKVQHALAHGLIPIVCIGERVRDPDAEYLQLLRRQIHTVLEPLSAKERLNVVFAYEPIWAIGKSAAEAITPSELREMILYIRKVLGSILPGDSADAVQVLYGGSVEPGNARDLAASGGINGFLVGHASVEPATFTALAKAVTAKGN